ncbi:MAG: sugar ABC transporter ATP-binding protein [Scrofimicrobium sp.]
MENDLGPLLEIDGVSKVFGATKALSDVNLRVNRGEIHSLLGRNGAGKSTLVNVVAGIYPPSSGVVRFDGHDIADANIFQRQEAGIQLVPQHENSFPELSVAENIFVGNLPLKNGAIDWKTVNEVATEQLATYGLDVDPKTRVAELSSIAARKLNIIRAIYSGAKLIILDEPTTALTTKEREELFTFVRELQAKGTAFIFISHYLGEVIELSDSITVLRDGLAFPVAEEDSSSEEAIGKLVAGTSVKLTHRRTDRVLEETPLLSLDSVVAPGLDGVSIEVRPGEVLGVIGFPGSGAREFCRALFGLEPITSGLVEIDGSPVALDSPVEAIASGIGYISFDRQREGLMPTFDVKGNIGVSSYLGRLKAKFGVVRLAEQRLMAEEFRKILNIKCETIDHPISSLSGGNQQKVLIARLMATTPRILILDEPTVGIDIQSREEVIGTVLDETEKGMSVIYLTNDYEELVRVADRLVFFDCGKVTATVDNKQLTVDDLVRLRDQGKEE